MADPLIQPMAWGQLGLAAVLAGWLGTAVGGQTLTEAPSAALRAHLTNDKFGIVTSIRGLPLGVREALQQLFGTASLEIAEPGAEFQSTEGAGHRGLPSRRLVAAGCSTDHCLVYYERGGFAHVWRVVAFHWTPEATRFEWGGAAAGGLGTIEDVRRAVLDGKVTAATSW